MGNCCKRESTTVVWAGDDWGSVVEEHYSKFGDEVDDDHEDHRITNTERQRLLGRSDSLSSLSGSSREMKVKITKRELEEIMARVEMQGLSMEQVLVRLINASHEHKFEIIEHNHHHHHHGHWKPALQSIPEVN